MTPQQTLLVAQQQQPQLFQCPCPCQCPNSSRSLQTRAPDCLSVLPTDQLPPVRLVCSSSSSLPSHAYNLRSSSCSLTFHPILSDHSPDCRGVSHCLAPSTDAYIPSLAYSYSSSPSPPLSPPFSFTSLDDVTCNGPFTHQDTTLNHSQQNALGVDFSQPIYSNNNYNSNNSFDQWLGLYQSSTQNPIASLLSSDINQKNTAGIANQGETVAPDGQSIINTIDNTVYQQLQGFNISNHLLNKNKSHLQQNMPSSSSPQTPRDGAAMLSSFGTGGGAGLAGTGMNKSSAEFDFGELECSMPLLEHERTTRLTCAMCTCFCQTDMLAASFLNDQVAAFDTLSTQPQASSNESYSNNTENSFFANLALVGSPAMNFNMPSSNSPPLQNAFRNFSSANNMLDASSISIPHEVPPPPPTRNNSSSTSSSSSPMLASPAFDASSNFPFTFNNMGLNGGGALYNSPNYSGIDTPALIPDDGLDLANALTTSPMWGQLDLGSISLFPQQEQKQQSNTTRRQQERIISPLQQVPSLPTISPTELSLPLPEKNVTSIANSSFKDQVRPVSSTVVANKANKKKRVRESPAFGSDDEDEDEQEARKKARRSTSMVAASSAAAIAAGQFNGTRHTSNAPLPLDAPTQPRTYHGPESKTSKRAVPAAAARKVAAIKAQAEYVKRARRSVSAVAVNAAEESANRNNGGDEDDEEEIEGEFKEAIEMSIEAKRRQNTIAARRSRMRKAEHLAGLENSIKTLTERVEMLENEKMVWMMRAMAAGWTENTRGA